MSGTPTILVVDDNVDMAENLKEILEDEDFHAVVAPDGPTALAVLEKGGVDVVITDIRMPGMDGIELLRAVNRRWPTLPTIVMSAYSSEETLENAAREGALGVLSKPVDMERIIDLVQRIAEPHASVLVLEDDPALRTNLAEALLDVGKVVPHSAPDIATAERLAGEIDFPIAIIDARLPDGDGLEFARRLRKQGKGAVVIMITGYAADLREQLESVLEAPQMRLLEKPFAPRTLLDLVRDAV